MKNKDRIVAMMKVSTFIRQVSEQPSLVDGISDAATYEAEQGLPTGTLEVVEMLRSPEVINLRKDYLELTDGERVVPDARTMEAFQSRAHRVDEILTAKYPAAKALVGGGWGPGGDGDGPGQFVFVFVAVVVGVASAAAAAAAGRASASAAASASASAAASAAAAASAMAVVNVAANGEP